MPAIPSNHILVSAYLGPRDATQENKIPVGAMVGGLAGGALLAILCTAGWLLWAKTMRKSKAAHKRDADRTKSNTRYNASALTRPWPRAYRPTLLRTSEPRVKFTEKSVTLSGPKPLRSAKTPAEMQQLQPPTARGGVPRLPSTVSSVSLYSAESAEEHQIRAPTSLILAALGSVEAALTRGSWADRRTTPLPRGSQATTGSAYSQDVGVAY
ncbi:hypothetical protein C8R43DRAFT_1022058 [Mycena crocata]|nr:hypothetical protein C8R43DRAFT_1022058 [Mycena crocata]